MGCAEWGRTVRSVGPSPGAFSQVEGLVTALICIPCLAVRQAPAGELLAFYDPGVPWFKWGCPIRGCGQRVIGPDELEGHTAAEHPGWVARYELLRPYPNQLQRVRGPAGRAADGDLTFAVGCRWWLVLVEQLAGARLSSAGSEPCVGAATHRRARRCADATQVIKGDPEALVADASSWPSCLAWVWSPDGRSIVQAEQQRPPAQGSVAAVRSVGLLVLTRVSLRLRKTGWLEG
jgi:hypothetical protein